MQSVTAFCIGLFNLLCMLPSVLLCYFWALIQYSFNKIIVLFNFAFTADLGGVVGEY